MKVKRTVLLILILIAVSKRYACLSEETLETVGPFYAWSMPGSKVHQYMKQNNIS